MRKGLQMTEPNNTPTSEELDTVPDPPRGENDPHSWEDTTSTPDGK